MKIAKTVLIIFFSLTINSFAAMLQKSQGNTQSLPTNNAVVPTAQNLVINVNPISVNATQSAVLSVTGGIGTVTYSVISGSCTISGSTLTAGSSAGTCTIRASIPASDYFLASSATTSITVNALQNQTLTTVANPSAIYPAGSSTLSTTGAQGSVSYTVQSGSCSVSGSTVSASQSGTCVIRANAAATASYLPGETTVSITVNALQNQNLTTVASPTSFSAPGSSILSTTGAQASVSYTVQSGSCSVSGSTVSSSTAGTCVIRANALAATGYNAGSTTTTITVTQQLAQSITQFYIEPNFLSLSTTTYLRVSGDNLGAVTFSKISGPCVIYMGNRMYTDELGTCVIRATTAANGSYASTFRDLTINITY